jgi:hypothetical protein
MLHTSDAAHYADLQWRTPGAGKIPVRPFPTRRGKVVPCKYSKISKVSDEESHVCVYIQTLPTDLPNVYADLMFTDMFFAATQLVIHFSRKPLIYTCRVTSGNLDADAKLQTGQISRIYLRQSV